MRADNDPINIVFDSPVELPLEPGSAELEIEDPDGVQVAVTPQPLQPVTSGEGELYRYRLPWKGPWTRTVGSEMTHLPAGNYRVIVRATLPGGTMKSEPYDRVSLVEVTSVVLEAIPPGVLDGNPTLDGIVGQLPSQERKYLDGSEARPGLRIFAESGTPGAPPANRVNVRVTTAPTLSDMPTPPQISVTIKSFDVDDPALPDSGVPNPADFDGDALGTMVADNRGTKCGQLISPFSASCSITVNLVPGDTVTTVFQVSGQPGDNYRIAASTHPPWIQSLRAVQASHFGEIKAESGTLRLGPEERKSVSDMLTVWRTLHLEADTTQPLPVFDTAEQRNFIRGDVTEITVGPIRQAVTY